METDEPRVSHDIATNIRRFEVFLFKVDIPEQGGKPRERIKKIKRVVSMGDCSEVGA